ncbi:stemmadenine O-acetyltransferase-like [Euphorbia lathyris]|uniref:stemmadenine O-acetyltransferase-like n=1 Tax=Euphorbia lathyris TaxID=212925 RepID=UPI0033144D73
MEVSVISVETIRPCSSHVHNLKPFNLCLLDQLTPTTYSPLILFYNTKNFHLKNTQITSQLKLSLSNTLNLYYPLSGRVKNNLIIDEFDAGVPYFKARVNGHLSDFIRDPKMEMFNMFLPYQPFCQQLDPTLALLAVQVNVFNCGGIALGMCFSHKINDGITGSSFIKTWAANSCDSGSYNKVIQPNLFEASTMFPPQKTLPSRYTSLMESLWFSEKRFRTRRFVFNANAVSALTDKGRSEFVKNTTRVEALSAFIWKCSMKACENISGSPRPSVMSQAVNIRRLTKPRMSRYAFGNLVWSAIARYNPDETKMEMKELVSLVRDGVGKVNSEYLKSLSGEKGSIAILEHLDELGAISMENPDVFSFFSWHTFDFSEIDFGYGKPVWVGIFGEASKNSACDSNFIILKDVGRSNSIEAWMTLDENTMDVLEHDPEFLAFASLNPCTNGGGDWEESLGMQLQCL